MGHLYDEYCPGLTDEIRGIADCLGLSFPKVLFCATISPFIQGCTHAVALPTITENHHLLVVRNYDMGLADTDLRLCTTQIANRYHHLGFSDMCIGRLDGLNQYGLSVTTSIAWDPIPDDWQVTRGLHYAIAVRAALEQCRDIDEAVDLWRHMPIGSNGIFLAADRFGNAACVEIAGCERAIKRIGSDTDDQFLVGTNHYTLVDFSGFTEHIPSSHSVRRRNILTSWLDENRGQINCDGIKSFLDRDWNTGVSSYSPEFRAGTLWSMVLDVTAGKVEIRFGPPPHNKWHSFTLEGTIGINEYMAEFPCE